MAKFIPEEPTLLLRSVSAVTDTESIRVSPPNLYSRQKISAILPVSYTPETDPLPADDEESDEPSVALYFGLKALLYQGSSIRVCFSEDRQNWLCSYVPSQDLGMLVASEEAYWEEVEQEGFRTINDGAEFTYFRVIIPESELSLSQGATGIDLFVQFIFETNVNASTDQFVEIDERTLYITRWPDGGDIPIVATTPPKKLLP
ncbi:hypothetical protein DYBT9275_02482 [Dyadobacter sp. CECT 9275]|uniref:Uncharacterized protein n=1 Tax=Dyadobacter helix TaxID=2822344 RepID=A0A916JBP2_9BACT|nr:hypothetical protein [Dyadobacter sp. CECT 9275]CAG5000531.1 hypothetical protein DYBT9275_02482 [Dyadobacter sp. CECT 9275]